ncbi:MAG: sigma-70 family RNA polymerase sigma factor [Elusimicrobiota bacterium]
MTSSTGSGEQALVARILAGEQEAYAQLVRKHHPGIFGLCAAMLGGRTQAEDAAQEVFLKAYKALPRFQGQASFHTWLYRIASNHCLDLLRQGLRRPAASWDELLQTQGDAVHRLLAARPDEQLRQEDADLVHRALACLPADYRLVLTLRELQGFSYEDIARAMDCSLDSVKARLRRARAELESRLRHFLSAEIV